MNDNKTPVCADIIAALRTAANGGLILTGKAAGVIVNPQCLEYAADLLEQLAAAQPNEPPTNADRIRAMSDEELADQLVISLEGLAPGKMWAAPATGKMYLSGASAARDMLVWLQQPALEEGKHE